jgi:hypothetical protein
MKTQNMMLCILFATMFLMLSIVAWLNAGVATTEAQAPAAPAAAVTPWSVDGNKLAAGDYLGSLNNKALEFKVFKQRALRIEPNPTSPNLIGGYKNNYVESGIAGAFIGGGGIGPEANYVSDSFGFVGGGKNNEAGNDSGTVDDALYAAVGGGTSNVAGNKWSTVGGGDDNKATGLAAAVCGGQSNKAVTDYATIPGGHNAVTFNFGQWAFSNGRFSADGDSQTSLFVLRQTTSNAAPDAMYVGNSGQRFIIPNNTTLGFDIQVVARGSTGASAGYQIRGMIKNTGGATTLVGAPSVTVLGEDDASWDATVQADDANDALVVLVTGAAGNTIRWTAAARTVEEQY